MTFRCVPVVACAAVLCAARPAAAGDDPPALASVPADGCFTRSYDAEHLRAHPGQKTVAIKALFHHQGLRLALAEPARTHFISAACSWAAQAGRDIEDKPLLAAFKGKGAYDCIVTTSEESAEEGGYLILAPTPDARTVTVYLDSPVAARATPGGKARSLDLGKEDRVFKLSRAPDATCKGWGR